MKNNFFLFVCLSFALFSCNEQPPTPVSADLAMYSIVDYPGTPLKKAVSADSNGKINEEGELLDGVKTGTWIRYYPSDGRVKSITNYVNGMKNGLHMELSNRGHVELQCYYTNDQLNGSYRTYRNGSRKQIEANYNMGILDGRYVEYNDRNNKVRKEMTYVNGKLDGQFKQYNQDGELVLEYQYDMGEKISGGIVSNDGQE